MYNTQKQKAAFRKCMRYAVLSLMLTLVLLGSTGCTMLLIGNDKKAYDRLVKAADDFYYPRDLRIVSGEMYGDYLYCVLSGKTKGRYTFERSYAISSSGYALEHYDSSAYKTGKLNYGLINAALSAHFGGASGNLSAQLIGGNTMSSGFATFLYIVIIAAFLGLNGYLASNASNIAEEKGYEKRKWFHICFWLSFVGYIIVAAMPDRVMRQKVDVTNVLLSQLLEAQQGTNVVTKSAAQQDVTSYLPEL